MMPKPLYNGKISNPIKKKIGIRAIADFGCRDQFYPARNVVQRRFFGRANDDSVLARKHFGDFSGNRFRFSVRAETG